MSANARWVMCLALLIVGVSSSARAGTVRPSPRPTPTIAPQSPMTLQQAIDYAQSRNVNVAQSYAQAISAASSLARARSTELPLLSGQLQSLLQRQSQSNSGTFAQFGLTPSPNFSQNTAQLLASLNVVNLNDTVTAREAKNAFDAALESLRLARQQTTLDVETSYYTLVQNASLENVARSDLSYNQALLTIAAANYQAGRVAGIDRLKAQVQVTSSDEKLASAVADTQDARENLALLIGAQPQQQFVVVDKIPMPEPPALDIARLDAIALTHRPEINVASDNVGNAYLDNVLIDAPNRPTIALTGAWGNQASPTARADQFAQCQANPGIFPCPGSTHFYNIGLQSTWTLPFIDWGATRAAHNSAYAKIDAERLALDNAKRQALVDVDQAARRVAVDRQNLTSALANAQLAKQVAQISEVQYKVGIIGQIDAVSSEQAYLQAAKDLLAAQVAYVLGIEKLKLSTGTLQTGSM